MVVLLLTVAAANLLWDAGVPSASSPVRISPDTDPFPLIPRAAILHVLPVPASTNASTWLTLLSIQGLANRNGAQLYLDSENEEGNASSMLSLLVAHYGVAYDVVDQAWVYSHYLPSVRGLVVVDPARPESVNIATMVASLQDAVIAGPDTAPSLERGYSLRVILDYGTSDWTSSDSVSAYDRALAELYPRMDPNLLAILPPDRLPLRDYLIATRTFVFYEPQGVFAMPAELAATQRILAATPHGIPVLGWFNNPTLTEENAFVQLASQYGKAVFGSQDVPNLSVLTAFGRNEIRSQPTPPPTPVLENKTYVVVAVPDGDNLDFIARRLPQLWAEPERGTFPIAWSLSPLLADLAPPFMDFYYGTASREDRFVLGPSGAGYVYPDYLGPGDLSPYVETTARYANATGMDVAWLLNAFVASEIPYQSSTLSAYVDALHPRGIVLDYDDQAKTQETWMQSGATAAAPVIRSTQLWTTMDNFFAKVGDAMATWDSGPHFLWVTVYTFRFDLHDAATMVRELTNRTSGRFEVVTPEQLFGLMEQDFVSRAQARLGSIRADPFAAAFLSPQIEAAQGWLEAPVIPGDTSSAAMNAYEASSNLREAALYEASVALGLAVVAGALIALSNPGPLRKMDAHAILAVGRPLLLLVATMALFVLAVRTALAANFWSYQWIVVGAIVAGAGRPLRRYLDRTYPKVSPLVTGGLDVVFVVLSLGTSTAFPLAAIGAVTVIDQALSRHAVPPGTVVVALCTGVALGFLAGIDPGTFLVLAAALMVLLALAPPRGQAVAPGVSKGALPRGFVLAFPSFALLVASTFFLSLRVGIEGSDLSLLAAALLVLGSLAGILAARRAGHSQTARVQVLTFAVTAVALLATALVTGTVASVLLLTLAVGAAAVAAATTLRRFAAAGRDPAAVAAVTVSWIPLLLMFYRMPPVVYSLAVGHFPEAVEAALYAPVFLFALIAGVLALVIVLRSLRSSSE